MTPIEEQFALLRAHSPQATLATSADGQAVVTIPGVALPPGWSTPTTTVRFIVPVGYPFSKPDCFWTDPGLRLQSGAMPQATGVQSPPGINEPQLWFSWHAGQWNPNRDNLLTYFYVIQNRLREAR